MYFFETKSPLVFFWIKDEKQTLLKTMIKTRLFSNRVYLLWKLLPFQHFEYTYTLNRYMYVCVVSILQISI